MAGRLLTVAGRQLSQHSGSGAPLLLRQVRGGCTGERDCWAPGGDGGGTPGSLFREASRGLDAWVFAERSLEMDSWVLGRERSGSC